LLLSKVEQFGVHWQKHGRGVTKTEYYSDSGGDIKIVPSQKAGRKYELMRRQHAWVR